MSGSEIDFSESSNLESPHPQDTPYSSPSQQVPQLANAFSGITCEDDPMHNGNGPYLRIVEQPQDYFRFRYKSEMVGTHGCILGKSSTTNKTRTHPTVELVNYTGEARIRVRLSQAEKDEEHPHKLLEDEQEDRDVTAVVPEQGSYRVGFAGMGIIHTAKKEVPKLLFEKYMQHSRNGNVKTPAELRTICENTAKSINLNIVRLKFSAHDLGTDKEICRPVFSEPIHNMKSAATNDLKICRVSRDEGRPRGGDDVIILVEKVNKKNVQIRFYELNENGEEVWSAHGNFSQGDVHHQYAIAFRTPAYRDLHIPRDVKVWMELVRPSDGRTSEPKPFNYKADPVFKSKKRRRENSSFTSLDSSSGSSIKSMCEVPATVEMIDQSDQGDPMSNIPLFQITQIPQIPVAQSNDLGDALLMNTGPPSAPGTSSVLVSPMLGAPNVPEPPVLSLTSEEFDRLIQLPPDDKKEFCEINWSEYMNKSLTDKSMNSMEFLRSLNLFPDGKVDMKKQPSSSSVNAKASKLLTPPRTSANVSAREAISPSRSSAGTSAPVAEQSKNSRGEYTAVYTLEDGNEVKKLVKEICELIKNKRAGPSKALVRAKLERLFALRLSNGDTFLHMALSSNQPSFEYIIKLISSMRMPQLLNLTNDLQQTILHVAILHDLPHLVALLVNKGCEPMAGDVEGNTALHYAVLCGGGALAPLLDAAAAARRECDLEATNNERQTALHLAAVCDSAASVGVLTSRGASLLARDAHARTPLHLALRDSRLAAAAALAARTPPCDIDALDGMGNTALEIICGSNDICQQKIDIVKLLLEKKAEAVRVGAGAWCAWRLARGHAALRRALEAAGVRGPTDDVKSEPEDEFESADEGEPYDYSTPKLTVPETGVSNSQKETPS